MISEIYSLFPDLTTVQKKQIAALQPLYEHWNAQINVISRKDMEHFYERHVLHSLALAFYFKPKPGMRVIDIGTGGGFPGISLAILYPEVDFLLVDSIGKKIKVVNEVAKELAVANVKTVQERVENVPQKFDAAITRAVSRLNVLIPYCTRGKMRAKELWCLKGGNLREEIEEIDKFPTVVYKLKDKLKTEFFETKKVVYVQLVS